MMVSGLSADAVRGIAQKKQDALSAGNVEELLRLNKSLYRGFLMMADGDGDDGDGDGDGDDTGGDGDGDGDDSGDDGNDDGTDDGDGDTVSKAEYEKLLKRMKAADQRASKAEKDKQERERKEKSDLENAQSDLQAEKERNTVLQSELTALRLNNAFLAANTITWHNPTAALKLAQSEGYLTDAVSEDGTVDEKGVKAALQKLAKDHQYLVNKGGGDGTGSSGDPVGSRSKNKDDKDAAAQKDARRAPSLGRRSRVAAGSDRR